MEDDCFSLDVSAGVDLVDLFFPPESFSFFFPFPWGHLVSMLQVFEKDYSIAFASTLTAFLTASSQESRPWSWASNWARIEGLRPFRKYRIMIFSFGVAAGSNS